MIEGTAASSSMAVPSGRRNQTGQVSVRNSAMPKLSGMAMRIAMVALERVPKIAMAAPNSSLMMSHSTRQMNPMPNLCSAGQATIAREIRIPTSETSTINEKLRVIL